MQEAAILSKLLKKAFEMSGESSPLGFDAKAIEPTLAKLPAGPTTGLEPLFASVWPSQGFQVGRIDLFSPERINNEHDELLPGCLIVERGFLGVGSGGSGAIFSYCIEDRKVYLITADDVTDDAVIAQPYKKLAPTPENIKAIAEESWASLGELFEWAYAELLKIESGSRG